MKLLILTLCLAYAVADVAHLVPNRKDAQAQILRQELDMGPEGTYQWAYETENGISASQQGQLNNPGSENAAQIVQGQAQWTSPNGETVQFSYTADEDGFHPVGSHLPTPPPIPEAILKGLEYIKAHPQPQEN